MIRILSTSLILLLFSITAFSQEKRSGCSELTVMGPPTAVPPGKITTFTATLTPPMDPSTYKVKWTVDSGKIISGQGTLRIEVKQPFDGTTVRATVDVTLTGWDECRRTGSDTGIPWDPPSSILIAEFGDGTDDELVDEIEKLTKAFAIDPTAEGRFIIYGIKEHIEVFISRIEALIPEDLDRSKLKLVNAGDSDGKELNLRVRVWVVPAGANPLGVNKLN